MHPNLLLRPRTVRAHPQNILHLRIADEQNVPRDEKPDPLAARRARQAAAVSPHFAEIARLLQGGGRGRSAVDAGGEGVEVGETRVYREGGGLLRIARRRGVVGRQERRLAEEVGVAEDSRVDADGEDGALGAFAVDVHEVQLGFGAVVLHRVVGGRVHVPADQVDGFIDAVVVEGEVGRIQVDRAVGRRGPGGAARFGEFEGWAVAPVVILPFYRARVVEDGDVGC